MFDFLFDWLPLTWQPLSKQILALAVIALAALALYWLTRRAVRMARQRGKLPEPVEAVALFFARYLLVLVVVLMSLQRLGVLANAWTTISAVLAMVAIGFFAVWSVLSNLMAALFLLVSRPFRVGDTVEILPEALKGKVIDLTFTFTTLKEEGGNLIRVPNNQFLQKLLRVQRGERRGDLAEQLAKETPTE